MMYSIIKERENMNKIILYLTIAVTIILLGGSIVLAEPPTDSGQLWSAITELQSNVANLQIDTGSIWTEITNLQNKDIDLQNQIDTIELTPGPQGPQGEQGSQGEPGATLHFGNIKYWNLPTRQQNFI
jgi:hypothetical protein